MIWNFGGDRQRGGAKITEEKPQAEDVADEDGSIREKAMRIARQVPRHAIGAVLDEVDAVASNPRRARALRAILIEHFNRLRPLKARRLFTSLLEPLLVDDPVLLRAESIAPGAFQRADVGGIWAALTQGPFRILAADVQAKLEDASKDVLAERIFSTPQARAMRATMAREAAAHIDGLRRNRKAQDEFLAAANREATRDARRQTPFLQRKAPITAETLALFISILREGDPLRHCLRDLRVRLANAPVGPGITIEPAVAAVVDACRETARIAPEQAESDPVLWLPALLALNGHRRYDVTLRIIREFGGSVAADEHPLHWAVFCHFAACCGTFADTLGALFTRDVVRNGQPVGLTRPVRSLLRDAVERFDVTLSLLATGGILSARNIGPRLQPMLAEISRVLDASVVPAVADRAHAALMTREGAVADHEDVIWILTLLNDWKRMLTAAGYVASELETLNRIILADAEVAHTRALKLEPGDDAPCRMDHLVRINAVLEALGTSIAAWANPMSQGMQTILHYYLRPGRRHAPEVERIIGGCVQAVRAELARSRHWQSAELSDLVELYDRRTTG